MEPVELLYPITFYQYLALHSGQRVDCCVTSAACPFEEGILKATPVTLLYKDHYQHLPSRDRDTL